MRGSEWGDTGETLTPSLKFKGVLKISVIIGISLVVQWLRLRAPSAGGPGSIPGQGTRSHMPLLRVRMLQLKKKRIPHATTKKIPHAAMKIPRAATKTLHSQINK